MAAIKRIAAALILLVPSSVHGERVYFNDTGIHVIEQDYENHNIFVLDGTTLTLDGGQSIKAPSSSDDGEDAIRVEDASFNATRGKIYGGLGVGGSGVTISTTRDSIYPSTAIFEAGVEIFGGDATRERTTKGGDAVQVLQSGSKAIFNGGRFVPGTGCDIRVCGTATADGVAVQVIEGEAIIRGGTFEGVLYNYGGNIELYGCVEYDVDMGKITGTLLDGSNVDVIYDDAGRSKPPSIVYQPEVCQQTASASGEDTPENNGGGTPGNGSQMSAVALFGLYVALL